MPDRVVLAEDDNDFREYLACALRQEGYRVVEVENGFELVEAIDHASFDAIVTDCYMPGLSGIEVLEAMALGGVAPRVVLISGFADRDLRRWAMLAGAGAILSKPFQLEALLGAVRGVLLAACRQDTVAAAGSDVTSEAVVI